MKKKPMNEEKKMNWKTIEFLSKELKFWLHDQISNILDRKITFLIFLILSVFFLLSYNECSFDGFPVVIIMVEKLFVGNPFVW